MLRNLVIVGAIVAASASIPAFYESNSEVINGMVREFGKSEEVTEVNVPVNHTRPQADQPVKSIELSGRRVRIAMDDKGHFSSEFKLNGRSIPSLIDTGATLVAINRSTARKIGLHLQSADFRYSVNTANGTAKAAATKIGSLQIGRIYVENVEAVVLEDGALDNALIGMSFLNRLDRFQVENGSLYLEQ